MAKSRSVDLVHLRQHIERLEGNRRAMGVLPFGVPVIDNALPGGGLALGALHEIAGSGDGVVDAAAAGFFAAGIAARTQGMVLWCVARPDVFAPGLFAPGLAQAGLAADRVIHVEAGDDTAVLTACEEGLRHGGLGAVIGEVSRLPMTASRRLQLVAEETRTVVLIVRRWRREKDAAEFGQPTAAMTRWRIMALPSVPLPVPGIGRARWRLELLRCKGGHMAQFDVEACDGQGCLALSAPLADGSAQAAVNQGAVRRRAAS